MEPYRRGQVGIRSLYEYVANEERLAKAWVVVRRNGRQSEKPETCAAIATFDREAESRIRDISGQLKSGSFTFADATAYLMRKLGKSPRPLVVADIPGRVVQRSILDVLQDKEIVPEVHKYVGQPTSYGGLKHRAVHMAIEAACETIHQGAAYYIRSDIPGFFTAIGRPEALRVVQSLLPDDSLATLLDEATYIEISNMSRFRESEKDLFPTPEEGIAQGCCLSPLLGNIVLYEFDLQMNCGSVVTLRYMDDFVILAPGKDDAEKAFSLGLKLLRKQGLKAYLPGRRGNKASQGFTSGGFDFLGCRITPRFVQPSRKAWKSFVDRVRQDLRHSRTALLKGQYSDSEAYNVSLLATLQRISRRVEGWTKQYKFCNKSNVFARVDVRINAEIRKYITAYSRRARGALPEQRQRMLGVWLAQDCRREPILPLRDKPEAES